MTEDEWLRSDHPEPMLELVRSRITIRQARLFACACCRSVWDHITDERSRRAVEVAELYADGKATAGDLGSAFRQAEDALEYGGGRMAKSAARSAATIEILAPREFDLFFNNDPMGFVRSSLLGVRQETLQASSDIPVEWRKQSEFLRDIVGNPYRYIGANLYWHTPTVVSLATAMYENRAFYRMPNLADALEDAGCDNADILAHCRGDGPHVRGCWVVDLVLGKQ